ncbi:MAG: tetratricopeptide repeat protein [Gammaproteobacteria bacterium]|nr:tetratricopeptide repeat protein [Gammaproteobacteria bacterium]
MASVTNFLKELRRRNVFKAGAAYVIVAWLIIQVAAITFPALQLPPWAITLVTVLILIGFPLILLFAWAFELTPEGLKPAEQIVLDGSISHISGRKFDFTIIGLLLIAIIFLVVENYVLEEEKPSPIAVTITEQVIEAKDETTVVVDDKSIAVLPFVNRSKSEDDVFFVDGIHDDILTQLAKIASLKVISRTSVMQYRDTRKTIRTIGDELGVATILEGGIQRAGNRVRINVQLIDANTDVHLWAETYNKELTAVNIFEIQEQIATEIANALRATLSLEEQERLKLVPTKNLDALEAYFLGKQRMVARTSDGLAEAVDYFQQAIALDADFALAYVGSSDVYQLQIGYSGLPKEVMNAKAEIAINKALALDDKLGEAYASLGLLKTDKGDHDGAEIAFKKALALNPNYATTYHWYGNLITAQGKLEEALALYLKGAELDPLSAILHAVIADQLVAMGRFEEGLTYHEKVIDIAPTSPIGYRGKGVYSWFVSGRLDEAARWLRKAYSFDPDNPQNNAMFAHLFWDLGDDRQAECWANRAVAMAPESYIPNSTLQLYYLYRGDETQSLEYARKALKIEPRASFSIPLASLRNHDVREGNFVKARDRYIEIFPELLEENKSKIDSLNFRAAIDLAAVLQKTGEYELADGLLNGSLRYMQNIQRLSVKGYWLRDVDVYTLQGKTRQALTALRQAMNAGYRGFWRYQLEHDPNLDSIRNEPEFQTMLEEIKADMAGQLARVKGMQHEGDVCVHTE